MKSRKKSREKKRNNAHLSTTPSRPAICPGPSSRPSCIIEMAPSSHGIRARRSIKFAAHAHILKSATGALAGAPELTGESSRRSASSAGTSPLVRWPFEGGARGGNEEAEARVVTRSRMEA